MAISQTIRLQKLLLPPGQRNPSMLTRLAVLSLRSLMQLMTEEEGNRLI